MQLYLWHAKAFNNLIGFNMNYTRYAISHLFKNFLENSRKTILINRLRYIVNFPYFFRLGVMRKVFIGHPKFIGNKQIGWVIKSILPIK